MDLVLEELHDLLEDALEDAIDLDKDLDNNDAYIRISRAIVALAIPSEVDIFDEKEYKGWYANLFNDDSMLYNDD